MTIRRHPADFRVTELTDPDFLAGLVKQPSRDARYAIYRLEKTSLTTPDAVGHVARAMRAKPTLFMYAGLKDKHAVTSQLIAAPMTALRGKAVPKLEGARPAPEELVKRAKGNQTGKPNGKPNENAKGALSAKPNFKPNSKPNSKAETLDNDESLEASIPSWSAELLGFSTRELDASTILGNQFELTVRGIDESECKMMDNYARLLRTTDSRSKTSKSNSVANTQAPTYSSNAPAMLVMNYFGAQRFGSARHGGGFVARRLIDDDFEGALKLAIATPARKDLGKTRTLSRACAMHWGKWEALVEMIPLMPERRAIEALAGGASFKDAFAMLPYFVQAMYIEAYQSHLWNDAAARIARAIAPATKDRATAQDEFGVMEFPKAAIVDGIGTTAAPILAAHVRAAHALAGHSASTANSPAASNSVERSQAAQSPLSHDWRSCVMPLLAKSSVLEEPWGGFAAEALAAEGISLEQLRVPGLRRPFFGEADRPLFIEVRDIVMDAPQRDEEAAANSTKALKRRIGFKLPRGAYATVVLRALGQ